MIGWLAGLLLLVAAVGIADAAISESVTTVAATAVNTTVTFGFEATTVIVINDGANEVFVTFSSGVATTASVRLNPGESLTWNWRTTQVGVICSAGETASVRVWAWRQW